MITEGQDLRAEGAELKALLENLDAQDWQRPTPFKNWTPWDVVAHLYLSDRAAVASLQGDDEFAKFTSIAANLLRGSLDTRSYTRSFVGELLSGKDLLKAWDEHLNEMCDLIVKSPEDRRCKWFGPDMGIRMFTVARQMETWAHAQDIYDLLGAQRAYHDRIRNIAHMGVRTFAWAFINRGLAVPSVVPFVKLTAPSGAIWKWNDSNESSKVEGLAAEFCHVVTQGRNIADTNLTLVGETAHKWMAIAQCFAGPPENPPPPGARTGKHEQSLSTG